jgi:AraC-like DNA-binding protein
LIPPPRGVTEQSFAPQTELLSVRFDLHWPDGRPLFDLDLPVIASAADFPDLRTSATALAGACLGTPLDAPGAARVGAMAIEQFARIEMAFAAYLVQWIDVLRSAGVTPTPDVPPDARVAEALRLLQDQDLPTPDLAKRLNLSISQLDRLFVRHVGRTPSAWREQRRLDRVRRALRHSTQPIKAIAYAEGFKRLSHFSAWFSRHAGLTARAYRQRGDASA